MKNRTENIVALLVLSTLVFFFHVQIWQGFLNLREKYLPCTFPITYTLGNFDDRFGISKDEFLLDIKMAEKNWEGSIGKQLFTYTPNGDLKINLVYDARQETSEKLDNLNSEIDNKKDSYDSLKSEYDRLQADYLASKDNVRTPGDVQILNQKINRLNNLANRLNNFASSINSQTKQYNTIGNELGDEFEEGLYHRDQNGRSIDIYQFKNQDNLIRLLTHELGHALSLEHSQNPKAIMYRLNKDNNYELSTDDILMLKEHCGIK